MRSAMLCSDETAQLLNRGYLQVPHAGPRPRGHRQNGPESDSEGGSEGDRDVQSTTTPPLAAAS